MSLKGHQKPVRGASDIWLTPKHILDALGEFDLDPCACEPPRPYDTAKTMITESQDGLAHEWHGRVWMNPPFSRKAEFFARLKHHGDGIALIPADTSTRFFRKYCWGSSGLLFLYERPKFLLPDGTTKGNSGGPIVLVAFGSYNTSVLRGLAWLGRFVPPAKDEWGFLE